MKQKIYFAGIDVQISRGCAYYKVDANGNYIASGWVNGESHDEISQRFLTIFNRISKDELMLIGIDAPRMPLKKLRKIKWDGKMKEWIKVDNSHKGYGKHAEVIIKSAGIANPQWTRPLKDSPDWMKLGYAIFQTLHKFQTFEVFPSAAYKLLNGKSDSKIELSFENFSTGPKDMLDAAAAAFTVRELNAGRGEELGGDDGLGTIVIPAIISKELPQSLLEFPV